MKLCVQYINTKLSQDGIFLHEHPWHAQSWGLECVQEVRRMSGVSTVRCDQCTMGLITTPSREGGPTRAMKLTGFMTNSECVAEELNLQCDGSHEHQPLTQGRAKKAAEYPEELCEAIVRGVIEQRNKDQEDVCEVINLIMESTLDNGEREEGVYTLRKGKFWDDVRGTELDETLVTEARAKEMK